MIFEAKEGNPELKECDALYMKRSESAGESIKQFFLTVNNLRAAKKDLGVVMEGIGLRIGGLGGPYTLIYQNGEVFAVDLQRKDRYGYMKLMDDDKSYDVRLCPVQVKIWITDGKYKIEMPYSDHNDVEMTFSLPEDFDFKKKKVEIECYDGNGKVVQPQGFLKKKCKRLAKMILKHLL